MRERGRFECQHKSDRLAIKTRYYSPHPSAATHTIKCRCEGRTNAAQWCVSEWRAYAATCFGQYRQHPRTAHSRTSTHTKHSTPHRYTLFLCVARRYVTTRQTAAKVCSPNVHRPVRTGCGLNTFGCVVYVRAVEHKPLFIFSFQTYAAARTMEAHMCAVDQTAGVSVGNSLKFCRVGTHSRRPLNSRADSQVRRRTV